jgi:NAD(P)H-hydrate epimerase
MRRIDRETIQRYGVSGLTLMERAAGAVAGAAAKYLPAGGRALVVCGGGSNGGDGLAAARILHEMGYRVRVALLADPGALPGDAAENLRRLPTGFDLGFDAAAWDETRPGVVIDALLGTGLSREVTGETADAVEWMNARDVPVVSADIPSGVDGLTGAVRGHAARAAETVTFACYKRGCLLYTGGVRGKLTVADIGVPRELLDGVGCRMWEAADVAASLPPRPPNSHKGHYGHVAAVAGSEGMMGAGALVSAAAMRAGAGLATWIHPRDAAAQPPWEVMTRPIAGLDGAFSEQSGEAVLRALEGKTVLAMGPGIGRSEGTAAMARQITARTAMPLEQTATHHRAAGHDDLLRNGSGCA